VIIGSVLSTILRWRSNDSAELLTPPTAHANTDSPERFPDSGPLRAHGTAEALRSPKPA